MGKRKIEVVDLPLGAVHPYENNPRINDEAVDGVAKSIEEYGFLQPLVIDHEGVIVVGHTRYKAATKLGLEKVPCIIIEEGELSPEEVRAYRIADNKMSDLSIWDNNKLLSELDGLEELFTGFETSDLFESASDFLPGSAALGEVLERNDEGVTYVFRVQTKDKALVDLLETAWFDITTKEAALDA